MNNTTALVTGANKGIGKQVARQLAQAGLTVYVGARDAARGQATVDEIGGDTRPLVLDVTDEDSVKAAANTIEALDVLINNAGIAPNMVSAPESNVAAFRHAYETNVFGVVAVTNAFLPALQRSHHPRIVNISSGTASLAASLDPDAGFATGSGGAAAAYRSSKIALNALTVFYSLDLADDGFKVNALAPGLRATDLNERAAASGNDPAEAATAVVRLGLLGDDGATGGFFSWDGTELSW